jgi:hypothetical protein
MIYNAYNPKILNCQIIIYYMPVTWNKTVIAGFKKILIVLIFVMLSSSFFILALNKNQNLTPFSENTKILDRNRTHSHQSFIENLDITGLDKNDNQFLIKAKKTHHDKSQILMDNIEVRIFLNKHKESEIYAQKGIYEIETKRSKLCGGIRIMMSNGDIIEAEAATVEHDKGKVYSSQPITVISNGDEIRADGFNIIYNDNQQEITFKGNVNAIISSRNNVE